MQMEQTQRLRDWAESHEWPMLRLGPFEKFEHGILVGPGQYAWQRFIIHADRELIDLGLRATDLPQYVPRIHHKVVGYELDGMNDLGAPRCLACALRTFGAAAMDLANRFANEQLEPICSEDSRPIPLYCGHCANWIMTVVESTPKHLIQHPHVRRDVRPRLRISRYLDQAANCWRDSKAGTSRPCDCCDWPCIEGYVIDPAIQPARPSMLAEAKDWPINWTQPKHSRYAEIDGRLVHRLCRECVNRA